MLDPVNTNTIYATAFPGGVFKSTDKGKTWTENNFALPSFEPDFPKEQGYYALEIDPNDSSTLYLGIFGKGVYKSEDSALTWKPMYGKFGQNRKIMVKGIKRIKVNPKYSEQVYLATTDGIYLSENMAESWKEINQGLTFSIDPEPGPENKQSTDQPNLEQKKQKKTSSKKPHLQVVK